MSQQFSVSPPNTLTESSRVVCFDHSCDDGSNVLDDVVVMPVEGE